MGPENSLPRHRPRIRLTFEELHSRTVPALLDGLEAESPSEVEQVAITKDEWADVAITMVAEEFVSEEFVGELIDESAWADFSITTFDESAVAEIAGDELAGEWQGDVLLFKGDDGVERPIMPYYRTLEFSADEFGTDEAFFDIKSEEGSSEEVPADWLFASFSGVADDTFVEDPAWAELTVVDPIPEEDLLFYTMMADGGEGEAVPTDDLMFYTMGAPVDGESIENLADGGEWIDPAVCYMAVDPIVEEAVVTTAVVAESVAEESDDDAGLLSAFSPDDFTAVNFDETEELEVTTEIAVAEPTVTPPVINEATESSSELPAYFSIDGSLLDFYLGDDLDETI